MSYERIKNFILDILFPPHCISCQREGSYLCEDCQSLIEILENLHCPVCGKRLSTINYITSGVCRKCGNKTELNGLYAATSYQNKIVRKLIDQFKGTPLVKELAKPLANLIITHFQLLNQRFAGFVLIPVPLYKSRLKQRGFNQAEEISKELSKSLKLSTISDVLIKIKKTLPGVGLSQEERKENIKGAFLVKNKDMIKNQKILLVDDIYTTGSTMSECARVLKTAGAKEIWGVVVTREEYKK